MRWGVEKRLEFIEFRLFWEGSINRADIVDQFGVSMPQASKDFALYTEKAPDNMVYDKSAKCYLAAPGYKPVFLEPRADTYLSRLQAGTSSLPIPCRHVKVEVLRPILIAIRNQRSIKIEYQSMNMHRPAPQWRWITPHALADDGLRWHARAWCHLDCKFKDFILSRCLQVQGQNKPAAKPEADRLWHEVFRVILIPNPVLGEAQQAIIAQDYGMMDGKVAVPVRKALLYYFQKRLRLDIADSVDRANETPVIIANQADFDGALTEAMSPLLGRAL